MGMGWKITGRTAEVNRQNCTCGKGYIITMAEIEESDYSPEDRYGDTYEVTTCPECRRK